MTRLAPPWFKFATFCFDSRQGEDGHAHSLKTVLKPTPVYPRAAMPLRSVSRSCIAGDNCLLPEQTCEICFTNACELASKSGVLEPAYVASFVLPTTARNASISA